MLAVPVLNGRSASSNIYKCSPAVAEKLHDLSCLSVVTS